MFVSFLEKVIKGKHYVHIHLRCQGNHPSRLKGKLLSVSSKIGQALGIKREGSEIYMSIVSPDNQETGIIEFICKNIFSTMNDCDSNQFYIKTYLR